MFLYKLSPKMCYFCIILTHLIADIYMNISLSNTYISGFMSYNMNGPFKLKTHILRTKILFFVLFDSILKYIFHIF